MPLQKKSISHLFVYGSLRRAVDHPMHRILKEGAEHIDSGTVAGKLYHIHPEYPGLTISENSNHQVLGEIYHLLNPSEVLTKLDLYEGYTPDIPGGSLFIRDSATVKPAKKTGSLKCWIYLYCGQVSEEQRIHSGDYLTSLPATSNI